MLNMSVTLSRIFGVLFVISLTSVALGQQEPQADSVLSESGTMKIIIEIHKIEKNMINKMHELDKDMRKLVEDNRKLVEDNIDGVNKNISDINRELGSLQASVTFIKWILATIAIPVALYVLSLSFRELMSYRKKKNEVPDKVIEGMTDTSIEPLADNNPIKQTSP